MLIKLGVGERISLNGLLNTYRGELGGVHKIFKILDKTSFSAKELKEINFKQQSNQSVSWDIKKDHLKKIELEENEVAIINGLLLDKNGKKEFTPSDRFLISVAEKIGFDFGLEEKAK